MARRIAPPALLLFLMAAAPAPATAQWIEGGNPVARESYPQTHSQVPDTAGGSIVLWSSWRNGYLGPDIYAQRITANGTIQPGWPAGGSPLCSAVGVQWYPRGVPDGLGGAVVVWMDGRTTVPYSTYRYALYAQHVMADGSIDARWPPDGVAVSPDTCTQDQPELAPDGSGGVYVGWSEPQGRVHVQHVTGDGVLAPGWPLQGVLPSSAIGEQDIEKAVPDGGGGVYVSWDDWRDGPPVGFLQHLASDGSVAPDWPADGLMFSAPGEWVPVGSTMCSDESGGVILFWRETVGAPYRWTVRSAHIASDGMESPRWTSPVVSTDGYSSAERADCTIAAGGGALVAWSFIQSGDSYPIYANKVRSDGTLASGWPQAGVLASGGGFNFEPKLVSDGSGGAYVAWAYFSGTTSDVLVQHIVAERGAVAPGWPSAGVSLTLGMYPDYVSSPSIVAAADGGAIVAWETYRGVYAQRIAPSGTEYFTYANVDRQVDPERVYLAWRPSSPSADTVTIYRRERKGAWSVLRTAFPDQGGNIVCEDLDVVSGMEYEYRLGAVLYGVEQFFGEVEVSVPLFTLRARPIAGNPARHDLTLSFTLPVPAPARLQLFDARGRLIESRDVGSMGVGRHSLTLGSDSRLASGIYVVRLTQGSKTFSSKVAFLR